MKDLEGSATGVTTAPVEECVPFLRAVDRYPSWHPDVVRQVEVVERDGEGNPTRGRGKLHVAVGPLVKDFDLILAVTLEDSHTVKLTRIPHDDEDEERFEVTWRLAEAPGGTRLRLDVRASLSVPRFLPVGGIGDRLAEGFVSAAARALDG
ncbi:MAG TPA: SRPBCC family protein [Solirubrobacteraceae bacterium]|nr:SRPBCC family protein [Solirubrobacteraceae bacterium]